MSILCKVHISVVSSYLDVANSGQYGTYPSTHTCLELVNLVSVPSSHLQVHNLHHYSAYRYILTSCTI